MQLITVIKFPLEARVIDLKNCGNFALDNSLFGSAGYRLRIFTRLGDRIVELALCNGLLRSWWIWETRKRLVVLLVLRL